MVTGGAVEPEQPEHTEQTSKKSDDTQGSQESRVYKIKSPADFLTSSKQKFVLAQSRFFREEVYLALLSLQGSLEDAFRGYLLLHSNFAGENTFPIVLGVMRSDPLHPLSYDEVDRIQRTEQLRERIASGEEITLAPSSVRAYQEFASVLLTRYGVLVVTSDEQLPAYAPPENPPEDDQENEVVEQVMRAWRRYKTHLTPLLGVFVLFLVGATTTILLQQARVVDVAPTPTRVVTQAATVAPAMAPTRPAAAAVTATTIVTPTLTLSPTPIPSPPPSDGLTPGRTAYVKATVTGLALRAEPNTTAAVQLYLEGDTAVDVVEGPVQANGYEWWRVRAANREGWCAGDFLEVR
jgi:hypothetical protein